MEEQNQNKIGMGSWWVNVLKKFKVIDFDTLSFRIVLLIIFLLPLFTLPVGVFAVDFSKAMFLYLGVSVASIFFLLARLIKKNILVPKSFILTSLFFVVVVWLASSLLSGNSVLSLVGTGYEIGTFTSILFLALIVFLVATIFHEVERIAFLYGMIFVSAVILFCVQFLHTGFGLPLPPWEMFRGRLTSVAGNWYDLGIFFGLIVILALSFLDLAKGEKRMRALLWTVLAMSLVAIFFVNFLILPFVLGLFMLALLFCRFIFPPLTGTEERVKRFDFLAPSFLVFLVIIIFAVGRGFIGKLITALGLQFTHYLPSWGATIDVIKSTVSANMFFGSGPNTFSHNWLVFKPEAVSHTILWDASFQSGVGKLPSMVAETGLLGAVALTLFVSALLYKGGIVFSSKQQNLKRMLLVPSFFGSVYLWVFTIVYSPGFLIFALAAILTGVFIASVNLLNDTPLREITFSKGTRKGYVVTSIVILMIGGFAYSTYLFSVKYVAGYFYTAALKEASVRSDMDKANVYLIRAVRLDPQAVYYRSAAEVGLLRLGRLIARSNELSIITEADKEYFRVTLESTVQNAKNATSIDPLDPQNWMELGRVYETILPFEPKSIKDSAIFAYREALRVSPRNPMPLVALARVELQTGNTDAALEYLHTSLTMKSDFVAGHMMLAEVALSQGKLKEAISEMEKSVLSNPNNPENIYIILRIGLLYYQDGDYNDAQNIFEKLVSVNPNYVDARYSLGLAYDKKGMTDRAIEQFEAINTLVPGNDEVQTILNNLRVDRGAFGNATAPEPEASAKKDIKKK